MTNYIDLTCLMVLVYALTHRPVVPRNLAVKFTAFNIERDIFFTMYIDFIYDQ